MQELRKLMPLGANIDELAAHMTLDKPELAATLAHLEAYDIVEIASAGFGGALHVEVERVHADKEVGHLGHYRLAEPREALRGEYPGAAVRTGVGTRRTRTSVGR